MATIQRMAPIFGVRDVRAALAFYARLGFHTREYGGGIYGFATRDNVELQLGSLPDGHDWTRTTAYLYVDDADHLANEWRAAGAEVHGPQDTDWGQHEGALVDLDGNIIRFGLSTMSSTVGKRMLNMPASRRVAISSSWSLLILASLTYRSRNVLLMVGSTALALTIAIVVTLYIVLGWGERDARNRTWWAAQRGKTR